MLTVISNSALFTSATFTKRPEMKCSQDLKKVVGLLVCLREQA